MDIVDYSSATLLSILQEEKTPTGLLIDLQAFFKKRMVIYKE
jgi:hypothetical protein